MRTNSAGQPGSARRPDADADIATAGELAVRPLSLSCSAADHVPAEASNADPIRCGLPDSIPRVSPRTSSGSPRGCATPGVRIGAVPGSNAAIACHGAWDPAGFPDLRGESPGSSPVSRCSARPRRSAPARQMRHTRALDPADQRTTTAGAPSPREGRGETDAGAWYCDQRLRMDGVRRQALGIGLAAPDEP